MQIELRVIICLLVSVGSQYMCALDIFAQLSLRFYFFEQCITLRWLLYLNDKLNECFDPPTNLVLFFFFLVNQ